MQNIDDFEIVEAWFKNIKSYIQKIQMKRRKKKDRNKDYILIEK
jgi:hypothetical protein